MSAQAATTCEAINDNFVRESGRVALGTYRLGLYKDPYLRFVSQSAFPDNMGKTITNVIAQRTIATGTGWEDIGVSGDPSAADNACLAPVKTVGYAFDTKTFSLRHQAVESNFICLEDVRTSAFPIDDVNNYIKILADNVNVEWIKRYDDDYLAYSTKLSVEPGLDTNSPTVAVTFNASTGLSTISNNMPAPTSVLTPGVLRQIHDNLYQENAGDDGDAVTDDGAPVFNVFAERATIENLIKLQEDVRQDIRWSDRVNDLLGANGSSLLPKKAYGGFVFHSRPFPKRFNDGAGGTFVEVAPYITTGAVKGTKAIINPAYKTAKYSSTVIFHPKAMEWLVPSTNVKVGKLTYDAQNYRGDFKWINEYDRNCNPDKNSGYWRAKMACAVKQIVPTWGYYILHLRCNLAADLVACPSGSGYGYLQ